MPTPRYVIDGFEELTQQDIFDLAVAHIGATRTPSLSGGNCKYGGTGCNAAPLIKPEYREELDARGEYDDETGGDPSWTGLFSDELVPSVNVDFIVDLQGAHDGPAQGWARATNGATFMYRWKGAMQGIAEDYGLDTTALDAIPVS